MVYTVEWLAWRERGKKNPGLGLVGWLNEHLIKPAVAWNRRQRDLNDLANLDALELHDIGLTRGDIPYVIARRKALRSDGGANDNASRRAA